MKKLIVLLFALALMTSHAESFSAKESTLKISYRFWNITDGYDHLTRAVISINGEEILVHSDHLQSQPQEIAVKVPFGEFQFSLTMWTLYDGVWEEHSISNSYSMTCSVFNLFESKKENHTLEIIFDLDRCVTYQYK